MFGRKKARPEHNAEYAKIDARLNGLADQAREHGPHTYPDGSPFETETHLVAMVDMGLRAASIRDLDTLSTALRVLKAYAAATTDGPTMAYMQDILDTRNRLIAVNAVPLERVLSDASLNLSAYWTATGQMDEAVRDELGLPPR